MSEGVCAFVCGRRGESGQHEVVGALSRRQQILPPYFTSLRWTGLRLPHWTVPISNSHKSASHFLYSGRGLLLPSQPPSTTHPTLPPNRFASLIHTLLLFCSCDWMVAGWMLMRVRQDVSIAQLLADWILGDCLRGIITGLGVYW